MVDGARRGLVTVVACVVACAFAAAIAAQAPGPARAPHVGRVRTADGKPVAAAAVTFVAQREFGAAGDSDVVRASSETNGRFRLDLLPTRRYSAWAAMAGEAGTIVGPLVPRGAVATELVVDAASAVAPSQFAVLGTAPWQEHGPLRVELVVAGCATLVLPATLDAEGRMPLPPLPDATAEVAVFARDRLVYTTVAGLRGALVLPAPQRLAARVQDDQGKPVAGAALHRLTASWSHGHDWPLPLPPHGDRHAFATTDAEGAAELLVAYRSDPFLGVGYPALVFVASKPGCVESASGITGVPFCNGGREDASKLGRTLLFTLAAKAESRGKVEAIAGHLPRALWFSAVLSLPYDKDSMTSTSDFGAVPVGADGTFTWPDRPKGWSLQALLVPGQVPQLAADDPFRRAAAPHTLVLPPTALQDEGGLDLRRLVPLRLQVLDATSGPAMGAAVLCAPKNGNQFVDAPYSMQAQTDAAGRLVLPLMPGTWLLVVVQGGTWARATLEVGNGLEPQTLQLGPLDRMPVRIVDGGGKPIAGARFESDGASWSSGGSAEEAFLCELGHLVSTWSMQQQVTDADGRAVIPFLASRWLKVDFVAKVGERKSAELHLRADEEPTEIVVK